MILALKIIEIVLAVLMMAAILLQQRGSGLGDAFGGGGGTYQSKRGFEKTLFRATIVLAILFVATAIASLLLQ